MFTGFLYYLSSPSRALWFSNRCSAALPSMAYSIFRKNISMKMVCGQTQPQNNRPKAAVNNTTNTIKVTMAKPKMKKSCGQNTLPKNDKVRLRYIKKKQGRPCTYTNGKAKNRIKKPRLIQVRKEYNLPLGFCAYTHFRLPDASTVAIRSRNDSFSSTPVGAMFRFRFHYLCF